MGCCGHRFHGYGPAQVHDGFVYPVRLRQRHFSPSYLLGGAIARLVVDIVPLHVDSIDNICLAGMVRSRSGVIFNSSSNKIVAFTIIFTAYSLQESSDVIASCHLRVGRRA